MGHSTSPFKRPPLHPLRTLPADAILRDMKTYWLAVLALFLVDAAIAALLFMRDGGPEALVWWALLIIPLLIVALIVVGIILQLVLG